MVRILLLKFLYRLQKYGSRKIWIDGKEFNAIIADTLTKRMIGLMFRKRISSGECMLFIFNRKDMHSIWMRNMQFPIDVIWLDQNMKIVSMMEGLKPCQSILDCDSYAPESGAKYIIELNAGAINKNRIKPSSKIKLG